MCNETQTKIGSDEPWADEQTTENAERAFPDVLPEASGPYSTVSIGQEQPHYLVLAQFMTDLNALFPDVEAASKLTQDRADSLFGPYYSTGGQFDARALWDDLNRAKGRELSYPEVRLFAKLWGRWTALHFLKEIDALPVQEQPAAMLKAIAQVAQDAARFA